MSSELKTCPWPHCDGSKLHVTSNGSESYFVECRDCGASGPVAPNEEEAIELWNRRTHPDTAMLDWLLKLIHDKGTDGLASFPWSIIREDEVDEDEDDPERLSFVLDRAAIQKAMAQQQNTP